MLETQLMASASNQTELACVFECRGAQRLSRFHPRRAQM